MQNPEAQAAILARHFEPLQAASMFIKWATQWASLTEEEAYTIFWSVQAELSEKKLSFNTIDQPVPEKQKPAPLSANKLAELDIPKPTWIINKLIPNGALVAFSGRPGSFKSFFALWVALRASEGLPLFQDLDEPFYTTQTTIKTPTLFIEEENTLPLMHARQISLKTTPSYDLHYFINQSFKLTNPDWLKAIKAFIEEKKVKLLILDPFSSIMGLEDENSNSEAATMMDLLRKEFLEKGITIIFLHHPSKGDGDGTNLRGAGDILGKCDVHLHFEKDEKDKNQFTVAYKKMRLIRETDIQDFKVRLTGDPELRDQTFRYLGTTRPKAEVQREETEKLILGEMPTFEELSRSEVAERLGLSSSHRGFRDAWASLVQKKTIAKAPNARKFFKKGAP